MHLNVGAAVLIGLLLLGSVGPCFDSAHCYETVWKETLYVGDTIESTTTMPNYLVGDGDIVIIDFVIYGEQTVEISYELNSEKDGYSVSWDLCTEEEYKRRIEGRGATSGNRLDYGVAIHTKKTMHIDQPDAHYYLMLSGSENGIPREKFSLHFFFFNKLF